MIRLSDYDLSEIVDGVVSDLKSNKVPTVFMDDYLDNYLSYCSSLKEITYPYTINVPRDIDYMLKTGDFSPAKTIVINEPILYNGKPIWTRSSLKGVGLGFGYENSNKKELSNVFLGNVSLTSGPHFHLGGKSGGGKSVSLANIIYNMLFGYSPYEINLHLIDAKIAEAARYAAGDLVPHIRTIGATSDTGYVISITDMIARKADKLNLLFGKVGVNNIKDFREVTGLTLPRDVLIVDEYQLQYLKATQKEATLLTKNYDKFCTAGRSSGTHLMLCTQSFLPELKKTLFKNIELRACLTCEPATSEGILGNYVASDCKFVGELYFNTAGDQSIESTRMFKVPFQDAEAFERHKTFLSKVSEEQGIYPQLNFFDETTEFTVNDFIDLAGKYYKNRRFILGTPAFLKDKENDVYYQDLTFDDMENVLLFSPRFKDVAEFLKLMTLNFQTFDNSKNKFYYIVADKALGNYIDLPEDARQFACKKATDPIMTYVCGMVYRKIAMIEADQEIFSGTMYIDASVKKFMEDRFANNTKMLTDLNIKRASLYYRKLSSNANYNKLCGINKDNPIINHVILTLEDLIMYSDDFLSSKVTSANLPVDYINLVGLDKFAGIARGNSMAFGSLFGEILLDAAEGNVCFLCYAVNLTGINQYKSNFKFMYTANAKNQEMKLGIELPAEVSEGLVYAVNPATSEMYRFKRLSLDIEDNGEDES